MIATEFGFIIAAPLIALGLTGKWLANHYHNRLYLIAGLLLALAISAVWLYYKALKIYIELTQKND